MHFTDDSGLVHEGFVEVAALTSGSKVEGVAVLEERNGRTAARWPGRKATLKLRL